MAFLLAEIKKKSTGCWQQNPENPVPALDPAHPPRTGGGAGWQTGFEFISNGPQPVVRFFIGWNMFSGKWIL